MRLAMPRLPTSSLAAPRLRCRARMRAAPEHEGRPVGDHREDGDAGHARRHAAADDAAAASRRRTSRIRSKIDAGRPGSRQAARSPTTSCRATPRRWDMACKGAEEMTGSGTITFGGDSLHRARSRMTMKQRRADPQHDDEATRAAHLATASSRRRGRRAPRSVNAGLTLDAPSAASICFDGHGFWRVALRAEEVAVQHDVVAVQLPVLDAAPLRVARARPSCRRCAPPRRASARASRSVCLRTSRWSRRRRS